MGGKKMSNINRRDTLKLAAAGVALVSTGAASAHQEKVPEAHDIAKLEARTRELRQGLAKLADRKDFEELLKIIHRPGWTTPAEYMFAVGILDSMTAHSSVLAGLKEVLMAGSRAVTAK
jgi:hypothetical protein